ncbi:MAG: hypothetical protein KIT31_42525, partial [Deltaproteobacteria bacterium]|nr:hypothetical protein [Deltaproteobacteria bacterium]
MGVEAAAVLDRHAAQRGGGAHVVSTLVGSPDAGKLVWGRWAATRGCLTLVAASERGAVEELLAQMPWS